MWPFKKPPEPKDEFYQPEIVPGSELRYVVGWDGEYLYWINKRRSEYGLLPISEEPYDPECGMIL